MEACRILRPQIRTVGNQFLHWEQRYQDRYVWDTRNGGGVHNIVPGSRLEEFPELVPLEFLCFDLTLTTFSYYTNVVAQNMSGRRGPIFTLQCFSTIGRHCIERLKQFCQQVKTLQHANAEDHRLANELEAELDELLSQFGPPGNDEVIDLTHLDLDDATLMPAPAPGTPSPSPSQDELPDDFLSASLDILSTPLQTTQTTTYAEEDTSNMVVVKVRAKFCNGHVMIFIF